MRKRNSGKRDEIGEKKVMPDEWRRNKRSEEKISRERKDRLRGGGREDYLREGRRRRGTSK